MRCDESGLRMSSSMRRFWSALLDELRVVPGNPAAVKAIIRMERFS